MVSETDIRAYLEEVSDPEIPVLTITDLGVVQQIYLQDQTWIVELTPTYSGCPAMQQIEVDLLAKLKEKGVPNAQVKHILSPAWTTDWITEAGRQKLRLYGIAPPVNEPDKTALFSEPPRVSCPKCNSNNTRMVSLFGSTACKAHYQCAACQEPFDYFKCLK
ncbi:MAG: phenylacetate-CoA oxygenase subunit PaaJ [Bacteroidota bacterium]|jgi:ring-1,2-phenylacetyl-CoA epoxidase subunit PaaD